MGTRGVQQKDRDEIQVSLFLTCSTAGVNEPAVCCCMSTFRIPAKSRQLIWRVSGFGYSNPIHVHLDRNLTSFGEDKGARICMMNFRIQLSVSVPSQQKDRSSRVSYVQLQL